MNPDSIVIQKINLAIKINSEFLQNHQLPTDRVSFLEGRIEAYEHAKEMLGEFIKENLTTCERIYK